MYFLWNSVSSLTNSSEVIYIQQNSIGKSNIKYCKKVLWNLQIKRKKIMYYQLSKKSTTKFLFANTLSLLLEVIHKFTWRKGKIKIILLLVSHLLWIKKKNMRHLQDRWSSIYITINIFFPFKCYFLNFLTFHCFLFTLLLKRLVLLIWYLPK